MSRLLARQRIKVSTMISLSKLTRPGEPSALSSTALPRPNAQITLQTEAMLQSNQTALSKSAPDQIVEHAAPGCLARSAHAPGRQQDPLTARPDAEHDQQRDRCRRAVEAHPHDRAVEDQPHNWLFERPRRFHASQSVFASNSNHSQDSTRLEP